MSCVLKADVQAFSALMRAGADAPVRKALEEATLVVAADAVALAQMARHMIEQVYAVPGQPLLRVALHYGPVQTRQRDTDLAHVTAWRSDTAISGARRAPIATAGGARVSCGAA